jgi:hypothetical protein
MIKHGVTRKFAGSFCLAEHGAKIALFGIAQEVLQITRQPILNALFGALHVAFEGVCQALNHLGLHGIGSPSNSFAMLATVPIISHNERNARSM